MGTITLKGVDLLFLLYSSLYYAHSTDGDLDFGNPNTFQQGGLIVFVESGGSFVMAKLLSTLMYLEGIFEISLKLGNFFSQYFRSKSERSELISSFSSNEFLEFLLEIRYRYDILKQVSFEIRVLF